MRPTTDCIKAIWEYSIKRIYPSLVFTLLLLPTLAKAEAFDVFKEPCLFVSLANGGVDAYPLAAIDGDFRLESDGVHITLFSGTVVKYNKNEYTDIGTEIPELPYMTSYKFNNKYNPNLNQDIVATEIDEVIDLRLNAIGKSLTASFGLSDSRAVAYIGNKLQTSK